MSSFLEELQWRGLLYQTAGTGLEEHLATPGRSGYVGFDPTANSLTIGNFIPIKLLMHWQRAGHKPIVVMGGGTGLIGDPSGKDEERQLLSVEQVQAHVDQAQKIFARHLDFDTKKPHCAELVNNLDWLQKLGYIEVLRTVGKSFSVNMMIQKDSVRERLHSRDYGLSYTEFSYMILQAYDFLHLRRVANCTVQLAGSDQYGNIVAGMDLIRREFGPEEGQAFGITAPLVTRAGGKKFGKTEEGSIWLTEDRTHPYAFYQFWINTEDNDVIPYLRMFTFLSREEIEALEAQHREAPHRRQAHRTLAQQMTEMVHGLEWLRRVEAASAALFGEGDIRQLDATLLDQVFAEVPHSSHDSKQLQGEGASLVEVLPQTSLASSKRQAREFLRNAAIFVNSEKVAEHRTLTRKDLLHGRYIVLRRGKKNWHVTDWKR